MQISFIVAAHEYWHYIFIRFLNLTMETAILDWFSVLLQYMCKNTVDISGPYWLFLFRGIFLLFNMLYVYAKSI